MTPEAASYAFKECLDGGWPVQITLDGTITFDFRHQLHAEVLFEILVEKGFEVTLNHDPHYARVS